MVTTDTAYRPSHSIALHRIHSPSDTKKKRSCVLYIVLHQTLHSFPLQIQSYVNCSGLDLELKSTNIKGCSDYVYKRVSYVPVPTVTTILKSSSLHETGATSVQAPAHSPSTTIHSVSPSPSGNAQWAMIKRSCTSSTCQPWLITRFVPQGIIPLW